MAKLVAAAATSHAFALRDPALWDAGRRRLQALYLEMHGEEAPEAPEVAAETDEDIALRYEAVRSGHDEVRRRFRGAALDALIVLGDDQNEHFTSETFLPAFAIYTGKKALRFPSEPNVIYRAHTDLAEHLYTSAMADGFDLTAIGSFANDTLRAHAFGPVIRRLCPDAQVPLVPMFVEALHMPAPSPRRCYELGRSLAAAIASWPGHARIGVCASGGISHYTPSFPFAHAPGAAFGAISSSFDRALMAQIESGEGEQWSALSNEELLRHGDHELHAWLTLLGMVGTAPGEVLAYEPFYRAIMGMGVAYWDLEKEAAGSTATSGTTAAR